MGLWRSRAPPDSVRLRGLAKRPTPNPRPDSVRLGEALTPPKRFLCHKKCEFGTSGDVLNDIECIVWQNEGGVVTTPDKRILGRQGNLFRDLNLINPSAFGVPFGDPPTSLRGIFCLFPSSGNSNLSTDHSRMLQMDETIEFEDGETLKEAGGDRSSCTAACTSGRSLWTHRID